VAVSVVGGLLKRIILRPKVKKLNWQQLCSGAVALREQFEARIEGETEESASISAGGMTVKEILAHLSVANSGIADRLDTLREGNAGSPSVPDLFPGAEGRSLPELKTEFDRSWKRLGEAAATPITNLQTQDHDFFGPMDAREWVALIAYHHQYHARQVDRIQRTDAWRQARGGKF
jgi:uncharacterized damage-inducible protein DinB